MDLPHQRLPLPLTGLNVSVYTGLNAQKLGWLLDGWDGIGSLNAPPLWLWAPLCSAKKVVHLQLKSCLQTIRRTCRLGTSLLDDSIFIIIIIITLIIIISVIMTMTNLMIEMMTIMMIKMMTMMKMKKMKRSTSSSVGFWPIARITPSNSWAEIAPLPSWKYWYWFFILWITICDIAPLPSCKHTTD